jgi:CO dehydrogenase maturation factor
MKLSICGKGGSGKSTIVCLLANEARERGYSVLVVDSDESNSGLFHMLGFDYPPVPLMELVGGKKVLKEKMAQVNVLTEPVITTTQIPERHLLKRDGLMLVSIGKILQALEGCACPMGVLSREFIGKINLQHNELVIVDMEAGIEHFGRGVDTSIDSLLVVVDPSLESINIGQKIHDLASEIGIHDVWTIMNKVPSGEIYTRLKMELEKRHMKVAGCIYLDADILRLSLDGVIPGSGVAVVEIKHILDRIFTESCMAAVM